MSNQTLSTKTCYYVTLEIERTASDDEIKRAYTKLALKYHPDRNLENKEEATKKFQEIAEVYEVLKDESKKKLYDLYGHNPPQHQVVEYQQVDPNQLFRMFFGGFGHMQAFPSFHFQYSGTDSSENGDFPSIVDLLDGRSSYVVKDRKRKRPAAVKCDLVVSSKDVKKEKTKRLKVTRQIQKKRGEIIDQTVILKVCLKKGILDGQEVIFEEEGNQIYGETPQDIIVVIRIKD
jgi:DnaJ family protein B protein 4